MSVIEVKGIVLYCDGSSVPNPGPMGWGIHGYAYQSSEVKKPITQDNHLITNYGYSHTNMEFSSDIVMKMRESVVPVEPIVYFDGIGSSLSFGTNNKAEISAILMAIEHVLDDYMPKELIIFTDSEYVVNGMTKWVRQWAKANWRKHDGQQVPNYELWDKMLAKLDQLHNLGIRLVVNWIKGHAGFLGNVQADVLAGIGTNYSIAGIVKQNWVVSDPRKYWKYEVPKNPLINYKRIYFNSNSKFNTPGNYFQADPGGSDFIIGKRIPEAGFSVVQLKEPDTAIEVVKQAMYGIPKDFNVIAMIKLDRLYDPTIYKYIDTHQEKALLKDKRNLNLNFLDRKPVCLEINPTGLSLRAVEAFGLLEEILTQFCKCRKDGSIPVTHKTYDITDRFYDRVEKQVRKETIVQTILKPEIGVGYDRMDIEITDSKLKPINFILLMGLDVLPRNNLKKLESCNPSIHLITWHETDNAIRYATIVDSDLGIGIYSNYYADKIYLT